MEYIPGSRSCNKVKSLLEQFVVSDSPRSKCRYRSIMRINRDFVNACYFRPADDIVCCHDIIYYEPQMTRIREIPGCYRPGDFTPESKVVAFVPFRHFSW